MAEVSLKHIYKVYPNGTKAVNDFNMHIEDKEFIVFVGPSGCGKSTTLRMIAGLEDVSAGELKIGDLIVNDVEPKDRDIAMVFQNYALYPHMTVYDNIAFGLRLKKLPREEIHKRVVEAADILGITEYLNKKPKEMSGGQRQRVALGRAIVREPKVMLLDEPLSNLDAKLRTQMRAEISKLHNRLQTTFIYVTHDQIEAMTMGTRIVVMKNGFVQQIDTPKNLYNYPENRFVASFIGTPQMNFFEGTLKREGDDVNMSFADCGVRITVPYSALYKAQPKYLDGETPVYIGLRAEDITIAEADGRAVIKVAVSHKEELGNETLVYGTIKPEGGYAEGAASIVFKDVSGRDIKAGDVLDVALRLERLHLFDKDTEMSVLPRIPEYNYLDCEVKGGRLEFAGAELALPEACRCADGKYQLLLPADAITPAGELKAKADDCEEINGVKLVALNIGGTRLYAVNLDAAAGKEVSFGIDLKKITLTADGECVVAPMPAENEIDCRFVKRKTVVTEEVNGRIKRKGAVRFGFEAEGAFFEASDTAVQKIFAALGIKKPLTAKFKLVCGVYDLAVAESGITAKVEGLVCYGAEKFLRCSVGGRDIYVAADREYCGDIYLAPDFEKTGVVETERDIKII